MESDIITFEACLHECIDTPELLKQFNRLQGCSLGIDTRPLIIRRVDEATGYQKVLDEKAQKDMDLFVAFCFEFIWLPLIADPLSVRNRQGLALE